MRRVHYRVDKSAWAEGFRYSDPRGDSDIREADYRLLSFLTLAGNWMLAFVTVSL